MSEYTQELLSKIAALEAGNESLRLVRDDLARQVNDYRAKWAALSVRTMPEVWTLAADQKPQTGKAVLAHYTNSHGMGRRIRAEYIAAWTVQAEDVSDPDTEFVEYSKAVNEGVITHWMPLQAAPAPTVEPAHSDDECSTHPDAPHGFNRNASHTEGRYVCDCYGWAPPIGVIAPRYLLEMIQYLLDEYVPHTTVEEDELRALLNGGRS